jgi:hypothetical protein
LWQKSRGTRRRPRFSRFISAASFHRGPERYLQAEKLYSKKFRFVKVSPALGLFLGAASSTVRFTHK